MVFQRQVVLCMYIAEWALEKLVGLGCGFGVLWFLEDL